MPKQTKEQLVAAIRADRDFWRSIVAEVGRHRMDESGPMGEWTFKDLAAHLAGWRSYRTAQLEAAGRGEPEPAPPWQAEEDDDDPINDWINDRSQDRSLDDVLADYDNSFERLAAALEALPESEIEDPGAFPWTDGEALADIDFTNHLHKEHMPAVRAWLDSQ